MPTNRRDYLHKLNANNITIVGAVH